MTSMNDISTRWGVQREETARKIEDLANKSRVEIQPVDDIEWSLNHPHGLLSPLYAQARVNGALVALIERQKEKRPSLTAHKLLIQWDEPCRTRTCDPLVKSQFRGILNRVP